MQKVLFFVVFIVLFFIPLVAQQAFAATVTYTPTNMSGDTNTALYGGSNVTISSGAAQLNWNRPAVDSNHVGYFRFNDLTSSLKDDSSNNNTGSKGSANTWKTSSSSKDIYAGTNAAVFNAVGSANILIGNHLAYEYTQPWTVMAAVKQNGPPAAGGASVIFTNVPSDSVTNKYPGYELWIDDSSHLHVRLIHDFSVNQYIGVSGSTNVTDNKWHYVTATYDGSGSWTGVKLYVDGVADTTTKESDTLGGGSIVWTGTGGNPYTIGNQQGSWLTQFNIKGSLDEFIEYNVVKSSSFISSYTTSSSLPPCDTDCVLNFHFDETSGTTATDSSPNAFNGTASDASILAGSTSTFPGFGGSSLAFDNTANSIASFPHISGYNFGNTYTVSLWANSLISGTSGTTESLIKNVDNNSPFPGWGSLSQYQNTSIKWWDGTEFQDSGFVMQTGWHNYVFRYNSGTLDFFVDGTNVKSLTGVPAPTAVGSSVPLQVGNWELTGFWDGYISNTTLSNTARSNSYISQFAKYYPSSGVESLASPSSAIGSGGGNFGASATITNMTANFSTPSTTSIQYRIGVGNTAAAATSNKQSQTYTTLAASNSLNLTGQYIDYDFKFNASTDASASATPTLSALTFTYTGGSDITPPTTPGTPSTSTPSNTATPTWTWTASTDTGGLASPPYTVQWSKDSTFTTGVSTDTASTNSYTHTTSLADGTWYFRVKATDTSSNSSPYSSNGSVVIDTVTPTTPGTPTTTSPSSTATPTFTWTASTDSGSGLAATPYVIQWSMDSSFTTASGSATASTNSYQFTTSNALFSGTWYVRVKATDAAGNNSSYSPTGSVVIHISNPSDIIIDNVTGSGTGFTQTGTWVTSTFTPGYVGSNYQTDNNTNKGSTTATWTPTIQTTGTYTVFINYISGSNRATNVPLTIVASDGVHNATLNELNGGNGTYTNLGNFPFVAGTNGYVLMSNTGTNGFVVADAVKFTYVSGSSDTTAPSTPGTPTTTSPTNTTTPTFTWTASTDNVSLGNPAYSVEWSKDSTFTSGVSTFSSNTNSYTIGSALSESTWYFRVLAIDSSANTSSYSSNGSVVIDTTAPSIPGSPSMTSPTNNNKPTFSWSASTDSGTGLTNPAYTVQWSQDAAFVTNVSTDTTNATSYTPVNSLGDGTWYFRVKASDTAGNSSSFTTNTAVVIDTAAPSTPGSPSTTTPTNSTSQTWTWSAATDTLSGVASYTWRILNNVNAVMSSGSTSSLNVVSNLAEGVYTFFVKAIDTAGNNGAESSGTVTVDTTNPSVPGTPTTTSPTNSTKPTWTWTASSDSGAGLASSAYTIEWSQDSSFTTGVNSSTSTTNSYTHIAGLSDGTWYFRVKATDAAGNSSSFSSNGSVVVDTTAPSAPGIPSTTSPSSTATPTWTWAASTDSGSGLATTSYTVQWSQDSTFTAGVSSDVSNTNAYTHTTSLADGTWYFRVKAADAVGNVSAYSGTGSVVINTSSPTDTPTPTTSSTPTTAPTSSPTPAPTAAPTSSSSSSSSTSSSTSSTTCGNAAPTSAPTLTAATAQDASSIMVYFTDATAPYDHYAIEFGTSSGNYSFGADDIGGQGLRNYLVQSLSANTTYYFRVRAGNGCMPGAWSNELSATTKPVVSTNNLVVTNTTVTPVNVSSTPTSSPATSKSSSAQLPSSSSSQQTSTSPHTNTNTSTQTSPSVKTYDVSIVVRDTQGKPVAGATVTLHSTPHTTTSNAQGIAIFHNIEQGKHTVEIAYANYKGSESINLSGNVKSFSVGVTVKQENILLDWRFFVPIIISGIVILILGVLLFKEKRKKKQGKLMSGLGVSNP